MPYVTGFRVYYRPAHQPGPFAQTVCIERQAFDEILEFERSRSADWTPVGHVEREVSHDRAPHYRWENVSARTQTRFDRARRPIRRG